MTDEQLRQIHAWWQVFQHGGELTEIRIVGKYTDSGYYKDINNLIRDVEANEHKGAVYFTINPPKEACYGRKQQEQMPTGGGKMATTQDADIASRRFVLLDLDCVTGVSDVNSTDEEKAFALQKCRDIFRYLRKEGFNDGIVNDSANGYHIFLPCELENTEENTKLVKRFISAIAMQFSDEHVKVDTSVFNASRIAKLPGTFSAKGSVESEDRPRRMCKILSVPVAVVATPRQYFERIANLYPEEERPSAYNNYSTQRFDLDEFITRHGIQVTKKIAVADGTRYILDHCLFNPNHRGKDAILFQHTSGAVAYYCFHNSCQGNDWRKLRETLDPGCYDRRYGVQPQLQRTWRRNEVNPQAPQEETPDKGKKWKKMSEIPRKEFDPSEYIPTGIPQFDDLIIGFKRKQVSLWSGYRGSAKSTIISQLVLNSANLGYKSAVWTGELSDGEFKTWLYLQAAGKNGNKQSQFNKFYYTPKEVAAKIDPWIDNYLWLYNNDYNDNYDALEADIREIVTKENIDQIFIDNLTILDIDELDHDIWKAQKAFMKRVHYLAIELNIHIHCICHPNKSAGFLRMNSISGSGHLPDIAQNTFIIHRINQDFDNLSKEFLGKATRDDILASGCTNVVEICKCRDKGAATDHFIKLWFELESNRLKNDIAEQIHYGWMEPSDIPPEPPKVEWTHEELVAWAKQNSNEEDMPDDIF